MESKGSNGHPALTDALTGLPNTLHWDTVFKVIFAAGDRGIPLTIILFEVDDFPGWTQGRDQESVDQTIRALGLALGSTTRQSDLAARIGETRFAFFLLDCNLAGGRLVADRLDALVDPIRTEAGMRFSMGVASYDRGMARSDQLMEAAEVALKTAQSHGGDQIEFYG